MERRSRQTKRSGPRPTAPTPARKRRVSRAEREARRQRQLYWFVAIAGGLILLILVGGAINEYFLKPRQVLATVDGVNIRRRDYWKVRSLELVNQISQYQQLAQIYAGDQQQQQQYLAFAQVAAEELDDIWGSTEVNESTLERMIEDQLYLQNAGDLGITISDQDIENWILSQFEPSNAPLQTPTASPTLIPTRAAWATETAIAGATQTAEAQATATASASAAAATATAEAAAASPSVEGIASPAASPGASPVADTASPEAAEDAAVAGSPAATPEASPVASPEGSPVASPVGSPEGPTPTTTPEPTPNPEQALSTAEAGYRQYRDAVFDQTHMSEEDYIRLVARPSIARERVRATLEAQVGQTAEQVHAAHILVDTRDLAVSLHEQLNQPGTSFEDLARSQSSDTSTAPNGGDLGWFTRNMMVEPFSEVAFALQPGQISEPFETEFGWHIVKVYDHQTDRPMTDEQITAEKEAIVQDWIDARRAEAEIESDHLEPTVTPVPGSQQFVPPPDAPPTPTPSPTAEASPVASPVASPSGSGGTPGATPVANESSPVAATPGASPQAATPAT